MNLICSNESFNDKDYIVYIKPLSKIGEIDKDISNSHSFSNLTKRFRSSIKFIDTSKLNIKKNMYSDAKSHPPTKRNESSVCTTVANGSSGPGSQIPLVTSYTWTSES